MRALMVVAGALLLLAFVWWLAKKLHRFAYWSEPTGRAAVAALARDGWSCDELPVAPGVELVGLVRPPRDATAPWVLFLPGNASSVAGAFAPVLDRVAAARGCGVAFWPWRGFDASTGTPTPEGLLDDARAGWRRLVVDRAVPPERLEVWGYSLGSGLAVQLAAELCAAGTPPRRLVLLAAYDRIQVMPWGALGRFRRDDVYDASAAAARVTCPVTIVHGSADAALPLAGARALERALVGAQVRFVELPGRGHTDWLDQLPTLGL